MKAGDSVKNEAYYDITDTYSVRKHVRKTRTIEMMLIEEQTRHWRSAHVRNSIILMSSTENSYSMILLAEREMKCLKRWIERYTMANSILQVKL